jgi:hypothetical protein
MATAEAVMPREKRDDVSVKIDATIHKRAKLIAASRDIPLAQYLSDLLRAPVSRDWQKLHQQMSDEADAK